MISIPVSEILTVGLIGLLAAVFAFWIVRRTRRKKNLYGSSPVEQLRFIFNYLQNRCHRLDPLMYETRRFPAYCMHL